MTIELVVARHREDLRWLRRVPKKIRVTVYDKGGHADSKHPLQNIGREAHTYLHHIVTRYDDLADLTVFAQGKPFDHVSTFHHKLRDLVSGHHVVKEFEWLGFIIDWDDATGSRLFRNWTKNDEKLSLPMDEFFRAMWNRTAPDRVVFYPSAHFIASKDLIRSQKLSFYEHALTVSETVRDAAHCFERCWDRVFGVNGIPAEFRDHELPVYTKPIRRLLDKAQA